MVANFGLPLGLALVDSEALFSLWIGVNGLWRLEIRINHMDWQSICYYTLMQSHVLREIN